MNKFTTDSTATVSAQPVGGPRKQPRRKTIRAVRWVPIFFAVAVAVAAPGVVGSRYSAKSGSIAFEAGSNIPFLHVAGTSTVVTGGGEGALEGDAATVRNLRFEIAPTTFKTGMKIRDEHLHDKVFKTANGEMPTIVLRADRFDAKLNPKTAKWEGTLNAQLTMHGVTKPVSFRASLEKKGNGALVSAEGSVKISDFGVPSISYSGATVNDSVAITVNRLRVDP